MTHVLTFVEAQRARASGRPAAIAAIVAMLTIIMARWAYLAIYGSPLPFYDQWDAEGERLLKPWIEGQFHLGLLFEAHNEHRIAWTRLLSISVFEITGRWDNLDLALASAAFSALVFGALASVAWRGLEGWLSRLTMLLLVVTLGVTPASWENILVGFQSQFYFLLLFGGATIAASALLTGARGCAAAATFGIASLFTMASGLVALVAAAATLVFAMVDRRQFRWPGTSLAVVLGALAVASFLAVPEIPPHQALRAQDVGELLRAAFVALSWPFVGTPWMAAILWSPFAATSLLALTRRPLGRLDHLGWGVALFALGQALAIAYSRGAGMEQVSSRYTDLLAMGLFANAFLAFRIARAARMVRPTLAYGALPNALLVIAALFAAGLIATMAKRANADISGMSSRSNQNCGHEAMVATYLRSGDPSAIPSPPAPLPYPDRDRLLKMLVDPTLAPLVASTSGLSPRRGCASTRIALGAVSDGGRPLPVVPGGAMTLTFQSPTDSAISAITLLVGTYGGMADGELNARVCSAGRCSSARTILHDAADNAPLWLQLDRPLVPALGAPTSIELALRNATHPLALWTYPTITPSVVPQSSPDHSAVAELIVVDVSPPR